MPDFDLQEELRRAAGQTVFGTIDLAGASRGYIRANSPPPVADAAIRRLGELSKGGPVTALHFKQAIQDFSATISAFNRAGNARGEKVARAAHDALVDTYIAQTGDRDVYQALPPKGQVLEIKTPG